MRIPQKYLRKSERRGGMVYVVPTFRPATSFWRSSAGLPTRSGQVPVSATKEFASPSPNFGNLTGSGKICKSDSMKLRISATETARRFSELMNRVHYRGESFVVERGGKPICEILPARPAKFNGRELADLLRSLPQPDKEYLALVERLTAKQSKVAESKWPR